MNEGAEKGEGGTEPPDLEESDEFPQPLSPCTAYRH